MNRYSRNSVMFSLAILVLFKPSIGISQSSNNEPESLIEILAENNFSKNEVWGAFNQLIKLQEKALPILVDHVDDTRIANKALQNSWSISCKGGEGNSCEVDVGFICREIIPSIMGFESGKHAAFSKSWTDDIKRWHEQRQGWTFTEMQAEILLLRMDEIRKEIEDASWEDAKVNAEKRLKKLQKKFKSLGAEAVRRDYKWQEPIKLDDNKAYEIAQEHLALQGYDKQKFAKSWVNYKRLDDTWTVIMVGKIPQMTEKQIYIVINDDDNSVIRYQEY